MSRLYESQQHAECYCQLSGTMRTPVKDVLMSLRRSEGCDCT